MVHEEATAPCILDAGYLEQLPQWLTATKQRAFVCSSANYTSY